MAPALPSGQGQACTAREPSDREQFWITVHSDFFMFQGPDDEEEGMQACLVVCDDDKNAFWAVGIKSKAVTHSLVKYYKDLLDQSGYEWGDDHHEV